MWSEDASGTYPPAEKILRVLYGHTCFPDLSLTIDKAEAEVEVEQAVHTEASSTATGDEDKVPDRGIQAQLE